MSDGIPFFFSAREIHTAAEFEWLRNTRTYIQLQYAACENNQLPELPWNKLFCSHCTARSCKMKGNEG